MKHPYLVNLKYAFQTEDKLYMVMDYVRGGELYQHLKRCKTFVPERVRLYAAEICLALTYLHDMQFVYRDLKPENLLLDDEGHIRLTDFGLAKKIADGQQTRTFCGTPEYMAPEILLDIGHNFAVDWCVTRHTSHVTRHTSHVTRHTSHVTRHTSHVTRHTSHVTHHTSHITGGAWASLCTRCMLVVRRFSRRRKKQCVSYITHHTSHVTQRMTT